MSRTYKDKRHSNEGKHYEFESYKRKQKRNQKQVRAMRAERDRVYAEYMLSF